MNKKIVNLVFMQKKNPDDWEKNPTKYVVTQNDMSLDNWIVTFNSSSDLPSSRIMSYTKKVLTKKGEVVLGSRIHFPMRESYSHATIKPLYEIMEYSSNGGLANIGNGVVSNVDIVKNVAVEVSGRNFRNRLFLRLIDQNRRFRDFFMGYLSFVGWRKLIWKNPHYIANVDKRDLFRPKLYPRELPYYKFYAFIVSRPYHGVKGDFVVYFKKVTMNYDLYNIYKDSLSIDDEKTWGIKKRRNIIRQAFLKKVNSNLRELRLYEERKMGMNIEHPNKPKTDKPKTDKTEDKS